jgi:serine/threonine protein phosphatase PrpC
MSAPAAAAGSFEWRSAAASAVGNVRPHNEDAVLELPAAGLWVVADGMGGHRAGDVASRMIVEGLGSVRRAQRFSELLDEVEDRLRGVNEHLYETAAARGGTMGSTVAALLAFDRHCLSVWAGDSRVYRLRAGAITCLTRDHSAVQDLLDRGVLAPEDAASHNSVNVITRAVGATSELCLDLELGALQHEDRYLLCSDGLYKELGDAEIATGLAQRDPHAACEALIATALAGTCADNVSVVVVDFSCGGRG